MYISDVVYRLVSVLYSIYRNKEIKTIRGNSSVCANILLARQKMNETNE